MKITVALFSFVTLFFIFISPDSYLLCFSILALLFLSFFWRKNEPKYLYVNLIIYLLTISVFLFYGALFNKSLISLSDGAKQTIELANILAVTSLLVYGLGIFTQIKNLTIFSIDILKNTLEQYETHRVLSFYIFFSIFVTLIDNFYLSIAGGQLFTAILYFKWVLLSFIIIHSIVIPHERKYVVFIIISEVLLSFSGFWSSYKDYLIVTIAAYFTFTNSITIKNLLATFLLAALLFFVSVVWSYSKGKYRYYLTGGERSQLVIKNNTFENIVKLWDIVSDDFSSKNFKENFLIGSETLLNRISYIEYFGRSIKQVPTFIPHEKGNLLMGAVEHVIKPRIIYKDKRTIDDSEITSKYTGTTFSGLSEGASFSLGTVAERYVDYGYIYMFIPIFIFGLYIGWMYKYFILHAYNIIWGLCFSAPYFNFMVMYGLPTTKFFGWSITYFLGLYIINKYLIKYLDQWLLKKEFRN